MDIVGGLTAARLALELARDLKAIDRSIDEATYKMKLADLMSALADAQVALSEARTRQVELEARLAEITSGPICPKCQEGRLKVVGVEDHDYSETQFHKVRCLTDSCGYEATRVYSPTRGTYTNDG